MVEPDGSTRCWTDALSDPKSIGLSGMNSAVTLRKSLPMVTSSGPLSPNRGALVALPAASRRTGSPIPTASARNWIEPAVTTCSLSATVT